MPAAGILGHRSNRRRTNRRDTGTRNVARPTPIGIVSVTPTGDDLTIVFNQPVSLSGIPQFAKGTLLPTGATLTAPDTVVLNYTSGGLPPRCFCGGVCSASSS